MKKLGLAGVQVVVVLVILEVLLRIFDPGGLSNWLDTVGLVSWRTNDYVFGYPSNVQFRRSTTITFTAGGTRLVPDTHPSTCDIVTIGDSFTHGSGVNDDETFTNQLALMFPNVEFWNAGVSSFNSHSVLLRMDSFLDADAFIYLIVDNDHWGVAKTKTFTPTLKTTDLFIFSYAKRFALNILGSPWVVEWERFDHDIDAIAAHENILMFGYDAVVGARAYQRQPEKVVWLDWSYHRISFFDPHPNAQGHYALAVLMRPYVEALLEAAC